MFKKSDCLSIEGDQLKIKVRNVLNPIPIQNIPDRAADHLIVKGDGQELDLEGLNVVYNGKTYTDENSKELDGKVLNIGEEYVVGFKNPGWKSGETHDLFFKIIQDRPIEIKITRTIK